MCCYDSMLYSLIYDNFSVNELIRIDEQKSRTTYLVNLPPYVLRVCTHHNCDFFGPSAMSNTTVSPSTCFFSSQKQLKVSNSEHQSESTQSVIDYMYVYAYIHSLYIYTHLFLCVYMILFVFSTRSIINSALIHFVANQPRRFKGLYPSGAAIISGNGPYNQERNGGYDVVESWLAFLLVWCVMLCLNLYEIMFF